jgi:hypothetical protein
VSGPSREPTEDDLVLSRSGLTRRARIRVRRYVAAMDIVAKTDMLLTLPLKYAHVINAGYGHDLLPKLNLAFWSLTFEISQKQPGIHGEIRRRRQRVGQKSSAILGATSG